MKRQHGFITLFTTLILVLLITLTVFIGAKRNILNQKTANNTYYSEVAFQNAEEGLRLLMADLSANPSSVTDSPAPSVSGSTSTGTYSAQYVSDDDGDRIISTGTDSGNACKTLTQLVIVSSGSSSAMSVAPTDALTSLGDVTLSGNASSDSTTAGGTITEKGSSDAGNTSDSSSVFANMTSDDFFMYYFGNLCPVAYAAGNASACKTEAYKTVKAASDGYVCETAGDCGSLDYESLYSSGYRIFWIDDTDSNITIKANSNKGTIGATADPVLILIMGSDGVTINGNTVINGVVYIDVPTTISVTQSDTTKTTGDTTLNGNATINGALLSSGNLTTNGTIKYTYSSDVVSNLPGTAASVGKSTGGWTDLN